MIKEFATIINKFGHIGKIDVECISSGRSSFSKIVKDYYISKTNSIKNIDLSTCPNVNTIYLNFNDLETLDISMCKKLRILQIRKNKIKHLDISKNSNLKYLTMDNIIDIDKITNKDLILKIYI